MKAFDDVNGKFEARLREHRVSVQTGRSGEAEVSVSSQIALLEVKFSEEVFERLQEPQFVAVEKSADSYLIYEIATIRPLHYQMIGMDERIPRDLRWEMMESVHESWKESNETWINVWAVPTKYRMDVKGESVEFVRDYSIPLPGSNVYLLSTEAVEKFLSLEDGVAIGKLLGFGIDLKVNLSSMVKYHMGAFGFTGTGKSNLLSYLIRKAMEVEKDLKVVVFDVAGEYGIHLLDKLIEEGEMYSTENINSADSFLDSQAIPDTLEEKISLEELEKYAEYFIKSKGVKRITTLTPPVLTLGRLYDTLQDGLNPGTALSEMNRLYRLITGKGYGENAQITELSHDDQVELMDILRNIMQYVNTRSNIYLTLNSILEFLEGGEESASSESSPEDLAKKVLERQDSKLVVVYVPDPDNARFIVSRFINELLYLKKTAGSRRKVLVVVDQAQGFIPDKTFKENHSDESNRAVEALLRQGRKYRAHCWLSTQRLAHLNTNAVQQLHSYFVSTLPRYYDRLVIADAFSLNTDIVEKTAELEPGQWLFVSYRATKRKNVPMFIQVENNEDVLVKGLRSLKVAGGGI